jgi:hypothetical protein
MAKHPCNKGLGEPTSVRFTKSTWTCMRSLSKQTKVPVTDIIRIAVNDLFDKDKPRQINIIREYIVPYNEKDDNTKVFCNE